LKSRERRFQKAFRCTEKAPVVKRTSAAEIFLRDDDVVAGAREHIRGGDRGVGMKVVVERVREEQHPLAIPLLCLKLRAKRLRRARCRGPPAPETFRRADVRGRAWSAPLHA